MKRSLVVVIACVGTPLSIRAQSFNIDLDVAIGGPEVGHGSPSASFGGAAANPGTWNAIDASGPNTLTTLNGLGGQPTAARIIATGGIGSAGGFNFPGNTGDLRLLMNDFADIGLPVQYHFSGFLPGRYLIYTYAIDPASSIQRDVLVTVPGAVVETEHVTGPMQPNTFQTGITNSIHDLTIGGSDFEIDVSGPDHFTRCEGFQIVAVPEPGTIAVGCAGCLFFIKRRAI